MNDLELDHQNILNGLFFEYFGVDTDEVVQVPGHASRRKYFILKKDDLVAVGVYGPTLPENQAFFYIQKQLFERGVPVPHILKVDDSGFCYLQSYHGPNDVLSYLENAGNHLDVLKKSVEVLAKMHLETRNEFDFSLCYPHQRFDINEVKREFWAFEHKYLANKGIALKEEYFKQDIELVKSILELIPDEEFVFMHRDFQTRNLLVDEAGNITIIDFQGGREGPIYYDLASLV
ncbi:MAG: phosphotransferase, partial [Candidatus Paceibacteria bacterium]